MNAAKVQLVREVGRVVRDLRQRADALGAAVAPEAFPALLRDARHRLAAARDRLVDAAQQFRHYRQTLDGLFGRLDALGPLPTLRRGYAIAMKGARVVSSRVGLSVGDGLLLKFQDGDVICQVTSV